MINVQGVSFSDKEWFSLQRAILWVFDFVAKRDGQVSKDEMQEFYNLTMKQEYVDPLQAAVMRSIGTDWQKVFTAFEADGRSPEEGLRDVKTILTEKLSAENVKAFITFLAVLGGVIASAPMGQGEVTTEELVALQVLLKLDEE